MEPLSMCIPESFDFLKVFGHLFHMTHYLYDLQVLKNDVNILSCDSTFSNELEHFKNIAMKSESYLKKWTALRNIFRSISHKCKISTTFEFIWITMLEIDYIHTIKSPCFNIESFFALTHYGISLLNVAIIRFVNKMDFDLFLNRSITVHYNARKELEHMFVKNEHELLVLWNNWLFDLTIINFMLFKVLKTHNFELACVMYQKAFLFNVQCKFIQKKYGKKDQFSNVIEDAKFLMRLYSWFKILYCCVKMTCFFLMYKKMKFVFEYRESYYISLRNDKMLREMKLHFLYDEIKALSTRLNPTDSFNNLSSIGYKQKTKQQIKMEMLQPITLSNEIFPDTIDMIDLNLNENYESIQKELKPGYMD